MKNFSQDLFISYSHIDNQPLSTGEMGWITRFHEALEALLDMRLGAEARIWRDDKLKGNDVFADEIVEQFAETAVLVSVLTPRYLKSEWCTREVAEFCRNAEKSGGIVVDNKARVFKVVKTPVDTQEPLPPILKEVLGYEFFTYEDGTPLELDPAYGPKYAQDFRRHIGKLAWDIAQLLRKLEAEAGPSVLRSQTQDTAKPAVYLADCSFDKKEAREIIDADLKLNGYTVLPDRELPRTEEEFVSEVEKMLKLCRLSVHLIGDTYGGVPDGPTLKSETILQNEIAADLSKTEELKRVIWVPEGTSSGQEQQQAFIEELHRDPGAQAGADLLTGDIEALKASVHNVLKNLEKPQPQMQEDQAAGGDQAKLIYLICDSKDRKATVPLRKFCRAQGFEVALPAFEGDAAEVREAHNGLMASCNAVIVYYGAGKEAWKRTIDNDLKKIACYRVGKELPVRYTYLADPKTDDKEDLIDMEESGLINGFGEFSEVRMEALLKALDPGSETR